MKKQKNILDFLTKDPNPYIRLEAFKTLSKITNDNSYWNLAIKDKERFISNYARLNIY